MFKKNIKTTQLARDLDLPQQTLQRLVAGTSPNPHIKTLKPIADFFDITLEQLKGEHPLPDALLETNLPTTKLNARKISVIAWENIESHLTHPQNHSQENHIFADQSLSEHAFALQLNDSSMEPYFPKDSFLILEPNKEAKDRHFVLVKIADSNIIIFRQLLIDGEHRYLKPLNPDFQAFQMRILKEQDTILGIMLEFRHRYNF